MTLTSGHQQHPMMPTNLYKPKSKIWLYMYIKELHLRNIADISKNTILLWNFSININGQTHRQMDKDKKTKTMFFLAYEVCQENIKMHIYLVDELYSTYIQFSYSTYIQFSRSAVRIYA